MTALPSRIPLARPLLVALIAAPLVFGLAACGKKGQPKPPAGQEGEYTYPHAYPAASSVLPGSTEDTSERDNPLSIFSGGSRTRTKNY